MSNVLSIPVRPPVEVPAPPPKVRKERPATEQEWALAVDIRAIGDEIEAVESLLTEKRDALRALIGNWRVDLGPEGSAMVVHMAGRSTLDVEALRIARPDLIPVLDAFTRTGNPRSYVKVSEPTKKQRAAAGRG